MWLRLLPEVVRSLARIEERLTRVEEQLREVSGMLLPLVAEDAENRRRLWRLRESPEYELAFSEEEPLVSVAIATYDRPRLLRERVLPSVLGQTYRNLDVIVVGDHAAEEVAEAVAAFDDPRLRYRNLTQRIVVGDDPERHWYVASTMARNEAFRMARGRWLVSFDDDDLMYPDHVRTLLDEARSRRLEVAYGRLRTVLSDGSTFELGDFPPRREQFGWQGAVYHAGLRFFERELVAAALQTPGDWFLLERMLRAGVRFGMSPTLVCDYFPSRG
ncbi:MAG TPA: glycosyltransferase [Thermoleophilaceae bacterium]|nr:glycosyltransferase [Thermoleophilaceae bacterium]